MRNIVTLLISVLIATAAGCGICAVAGWRILPLGMSAAAASALIAAAIAFVPLILARGSDQAVMAQAALIGTAVHLMTCLVAAAVLLLVLRNPSATYWTLAFYWATLIALVVAFSRAIKAAPPAPAAGASPKQP
jgi:hypothetical protein